MSEEQENEFYYKELIKLKRKIKRGEIQIGGVISDELVESWRKTAPVSTKYEY